jgi:hypothetical protein
MVQAEWASSSSTKWSACSEPSVRSIRGALAFLDNDELLSHWPEWLHGPIGMSNPPGNAYFKILKTSMTMRHF